MRLFLKKYLNEETLETLQKKYGWKRNDYINHVHGYNLPMPDKIVKYCKAIALAHSLKYEDILIECIESIMKHDL